ncbi:MAG: hypothetical protein IPJ40_22315 [Saprospirales bacterium]|nr:hypothetical protein [Saprospirales bacterium]
MQGIVLPDGKGGYTIKIEEIEYPGEFGSELILPEGKLTLSRTRSLESGTSMEIMALPIRDMADYFLENLEVAAKGEESSTLNLTLKDESGERARDVLMGVIEAYNRKSVEDKNKAFENTIDLINERVQLIASELSEAELDVEAYKQQYSMVELSSESTLLLGEMATYNRDISNTGVQLEIMTSMEKFLVENQNNFEFVPTNVSINNLTLAKQLESFNQLLADRAIEESKKRRQTPRHSAHSKTDPKPAGDDH